jgi:hypothetical protein
MNMLGAPKYTVNNPQENGYPESENDDELVIQLEVHSTPEDGSPRE